MCYRKHYRRFTATLLARRTMMALLSTALSHRPVLRQSTLFGVSLLFFLHIGWNLPFRIAQDKLLAVVLAASMVFISALEIGVVVYNQQRQTSSDKCAGHDYIGLVRSLDGALVVGPVMLYCVAYIFKKCKCCHTAPRCCRRKADKEDSRRRVAVAKQSDGP